MNMKEWVQQVIKPAEIEKYLVNGKDFIDEKSIFGNLEKYRQPDKQQVRDILQKSLDIKLLSPEETAVLLNVEDPGLLEEMREAALQVKKKVYDNRIVFFAPLYCSNLCVNSCVYCGFRSDNCAEKRHVLTMEEVRRETEAVIDEGQKRLIAVYGEHPQSDADYRAGIGTYQLFQETYHPGRYAELHPANTIKGNFRWRLYAMHRAMDAGIDDVAIGALFGLYAWRFEVMGLVHHAHDLERQFGIGPHTISFPRMQPALGSFVSENSPYLVRDDAFRRLVTVLRLAVPYTGLIVTARERAELRREIINYGCTQTDASSKIGIGAYSEKKVQEENPDKVQFMLGDERSLDEVIRELAGDGYITSFCTDGYRCGRTGDKIMNLLEKGVEGKFCKLNAVLTFREYLNDYASAETRRIGEQLIEKELQEIEGMSFFTDKKLLPTFLNYYKRIASGERDLYM